MSKEYIEREALLKNFKECLKYQEENGYWQVTKQMQLTINKIEGFPAADVEPVRHARWVKITKPQKSNEGFFYWNAIPKTIYFCSYCGRKETRKEPYCNCGAKMDGDN